MAPRSIPCDINRLWCSIEDRLSETEQAELAEHLEACASCREELERLAASSQLWGDAHLLRGAAGPDAALTVGLAPGTREEADEVEEESHESAWLRLLDPPDPDRPNMLGRLKSYEVLEVLGQGGMGVVLKARDPALDRTVAIKVLTPALAHTATARRRFAREARAAAAVGHEHIVAIHAVDEFRGLPYLVMQYIPGRSLQERLDASGPLEVKEILRIGTQAARALAAAHAQGVVHRDIKPANILLENCVERVKLTDFGLARAIDDASLTQSGVIAGTPQYMAPEQARGEPVDARADLFSLGAVLYAMAAGRPPFRADTAMAVLKRVCDDRHRSIRELNADVPDWLEAVIDRLLAKDPSLRFQSAAAVAELLERGLAHLQQPMAVPRPVVLPVLAAVGAGNDEPVRTPSPAVSIRPFGRRSLAVAAGLILVALAGLGASDAAGLTQVSEFVATILRIKTPEGTLVVNVDDPSVKVDVDNEMVIIGGAGPQEVRLRIGKHHVQATRNGQPVRDEIISITKGKKEIVSIALEPAVVAEASEPDRMVAPASHAVQCTSCHMMQQDVPLGALPEKHPQMGPFDAYYAVLNPHGYTPNPVTGGHPIRSRALVWSLAFSPDGRRLAIGQQGIDGQASPLRIWDINGRRDVAWLARLSAYRCVAFSPDGKLLAAGSADGGLTLLDAETGKPRRQDEYQGSPVGALAFLPDGGKIAAGSWDGKVRFWNVATKTEHPSLRYPDRVFALAVSPDGRSLAVAGQAGTIQVYDVTTGRLKTTLWGSAGAVDSLDFSPDGKLLASAGSLTIRIWDTATWKDTGRRIHHASRMLCVKFSPDSKLLAISDGNPEVRPDVELRSSVVLWDVAMRTEVRKLKGHTNSIFTLAFSPDGKALASGSMDQTVKLWDVATGALRETIVPGETGTSLGIGVASEAAKPPGIQADPRSEHWAGSADHSSLRPEIVLPHESTGKTDARGEKPGAFIPAGAVHPARSRALVWSLAYSPDGRRLAIGQQGLDGKESVLRIWDLAAKRDVMWMARPSAYRCVAFSQDGKRLASGTFDCVVEMYRLNGDVATMDHLWSDLGEPINALAFLPGGRVAIGDWAGNIVYLRTTEQSQTIARYGSRIFTLAASPDGSTLAVGGESGLIQLYEADSGQCRASLHGHDLAVESLDFSPDGKQLASASWDKTLRVWDVQTGREVRRIAHSEDERLAVRFSPDGKTLACAGGRPANPRTEPMPCSVQLWDAATGTLLHVLSGHTNSIYALAFSPDGKTLASGSLDQTVKIWDVATGALRETIVPGETGTSLGVDRSSATGPQSLAAPTPVANVSAAHNPETLLSRPEAILPHGDKVQAWSAAYSHDGKTLVTGGSSGVLIRWYVDKIPEGARLLYGQFSPVNTIAFSPDGKRFATGAQDHTIGLWAADGDLLEILKGHGEAVRSVAFSPDGRLLASGSSDRTAKVWDGVTGNLVCTIPAQRDPVQAVAFSPDGRLLATGSGDGQTKKTGEVRVWDPKTGQLIMPLMDTSRDVKALAFSPDGTRLAVANGGAEGRVAILSLSIGDERSTIGPIERLDCPTGATAVAFSADGKVLVAAQANGKLRLWNAKTLAPLVGGPVPVHGDFIFDLSFSPDGKHIATASKDGTVKIWTLDSLLKPVGDSAPASRR